MNTYPNNNTFYVYAYLRQNGTPYYIGKGNGDRAFRNYRKRCVRPPKDKSRVVILFENLFEPASFQIEMLFIRMFGRIDLGTGCLHNRTSGGEGISGYRRSPESIAKQIETMKRNNKKQSNATILKRINTRKLNGTLNPNTLDSLHKTKIKRIANGSYKRTPEAIAKQIATQKRNGTNKRTPESIAKGLATKLARKSITIDNPTH